MTTFFDSRTVGKTICPKTKPFSVHKWLLNPDYVISDMSMTYEIEFVCQQCGRKESFDGKIMDWKQSERLEKEGFPGEPAEE